MRRQIGKRYSPEVYERACEWFVEFRAAAADEQVRHDFHAWLQQAPAHMAAYLDVASSWNWTESLDVSSRFSKEGLIEQARDSNLVAYPGNAPREKSPDRRRRGSPARKAAAAAVAAAILGAVLAGWLQLGRGPLYSTGIGQKRLIRLPDGSSIRLNASSQIRVRYGPHRREIDLLRGQALFADTYDPHRPFLVRSPATVVRAIGTQFDVNLLDAETIVTVIQGKVAVAPQRHGPLTPANLVPPRAVAAPAGASTVYLSAGEQLTVTPTWPMTPVRTNVTDAIAWTHHQLIFSSTALRDVVQEFNRYNPRPLIIASPSLESFRIDGVFSSTDPKSLLAFLQQYPGIRVTQTAANVVISRQ